MEKDTKASDVIKTFFIAGSAVLGVFAAAWLIEYFAKQNTPPGLESGEMYMLNTIGLGDLMKVYEPQSSSNTSVGAALSVTLDTGPHGGRLFLTIFVASSGAATFTIAASVDGITYRDFDTIVLIGPGDDDAAYINAHRYIRVSTPAANNNTIEINSSR